MNHFIIAKYCKHQTTMASFLGLQFLDALFRPYKRKTRVPRFPGSKPIHPHRGTPSQGAHARTRSHALRMAPWMWGFPQPKPAGAMSLRSFLLPGASSGCLPSQCRILISPQPSYVLNPNCHKHIVSTTKAKGLQAKLSTCSIPSAKRFTA